jgi:hypothetical protein
LIIQGGQLRRCDCSIAGLSHRRLESRGRCPCRVVVPILPDFQTRKKRADVVASALLFIALTKSYAALRSSAEVTRTISSKSAR